ncbi:MAG: hypothetical protein AABX93_03420 [Nanoarchaeota archaeon]
MADNYQKGVDYSGLRIKDLEEKQNILKDRLLLIGQNLVDFREENSEKMIEVKKEIELLKQDVERIKSFIEIVSSELGKFAKKDDLEILKKQAKMFQPLEFVRKSELKNMNYN